MKKIIIILLALLSFASYGQAEFEKVAIKENVETASTTKIVSQQPGSGELNYINATALPISTPTQNALDMKLNISDLPTNLTLYPTTAASDVGGYVKMVTDIHDADYNTVAVDVSTPTITGTAQLVSQRVSAPGVLVGQPGVFNITNFGNIRRLSGTGSATFYFEVYHRDLSGAETLICTSSVSDAVSLSTYSEFTASGVWDDGDFIATDRIVIKTYANRIAGGTDPVYQFQFGGTQPVRTLLPVPFSVVDAGYELKANKQNSLAIDGTGTKYPTVDAVNGLKWIKSNESLSLAQRKGDILYGILDQYTGEELTLYKIIPEEGNEPTVDNIIYYQLSGNYFKRNFSYIRPEWFGAKADGINDDTEAIKNSILAFQGLGGVIKLSDGIYTTTKAIQLNRGLTLTGNGVTKTTIKRSTSISETINAETVLAVLYISGGWNHVSDINIDGNIGVNGVHFSINIGAKGSLKNMAINYCNKAVMETGGLFLTEFINVQVVSCEYGFDLYTDNQKTSLVFRNCYSANTGTPFKFKNVNYSTLIDCAADNSNWGTLPDNPYGSGFGNPATGDGIYTFEQCDLTVTNCGAEGGYGNGVFSFINSIVTVNSMFSYDCKSLFQPNYTSYPTYAVAPIQCGTSGNKITINNTHNREWSNTWVSTNEPTKPIAKTVAFNYDEAVLGIIDGVQVTLNNDFVSEAEGAVLGYGNKSRYVLNTASNSKAPAFDVAVSGSISLIQYNWTKILFDTKNFDTNNSFNTSLGRFIPNVSGYYLLTCMIHFRRTGLPLNGNAVAIFKNGVNLRDITGFDNTNSNYKTNGSALVYLNGTTDYIELFANANEAGVVVGVLPVWTSFQGVFVRD